MLIKKSKYKKDKVFVEINLFIILVKVKTILLPCTKLQPKQLIRHKFLKDEFSKDSQR